MIVVVRSCGDVGSAVAHLLFSSGNVVVIHDLPKPAHMRRAFAFTDALFEGRAELEGVIAKRISDMKSLEYTLRCRRAISVSTAPWGELVATVKPDVIVDARMRKREVPEAQLAQAPLTIGLGPNFTAGVNVHVAVETAWGEHLGKVIRHGSTKKLAGGPRALGNLGRERFVYSSIAGTFRTHLDIGIAVDTGDLVGRVDDFEVRAPVRGRIRGLSHDGARVDVGSKIVEVDPTDGGPIPRGLAERPWAIAQGVLKAMPVAAV
jgi:xanthine dehydrogenase accessory factor